MSILALIVVLGVLIFVHELGHFVAAKMVGIEVQRFSMGLGPKVFGVQRGETEYVLSALPLGGYVKMGGMDDEVMERVEGGASKAPREPRDSDFDQKPIWARTIVISAGVIMNVVFAFVAYSFIAAQWGIPNYATTRVGEVVADALPPGAEALASVEPGSRIIRVAERDVEDWTGVQDGLIDAPVGPAMIALADPTRVVQVSIPADLDERLALARSLQPWVAAGVGGTFPGSPADDGGIEPGDRITAVAGVPVANWYDLVHQIESRPDQHVDITLEREGRSLIRSVTVDSESERRDGSKVVVGKIGIVQPEVATTNAEATLGEALVHGYRQTVATTVLILDFLRDLVTGRLSPRSVGSVVTIGAAFGQAARAGADVFLGFMAFLSLNLAVLNLLPIPVLDGGHLLFLAIEAVRGGRALSVEQRLRWSNVGFIVLVGITLWALSNDFLRLLGM